MAQGDLQFLSPAAKHRHVRTRMGCKMSIMPLAYLHHACTMPTLSAPAVVYHTCTCSCVRHLHLHLYWACTTPSICKLNETEKEVVESSGGTIMWSPCR